MEDIIEGYVEVDLVYEDGAPTEMGRHAKIVGLEVMINGGVAREKSEDTLEKQREKQGRQKRAHTIFCLENDNYWDSGGEGKVRAWRGYAHNCAIIQLE